MKFLKKLMIVFGLLALLGTGPVVHAGGQKTNIREDDIPGVFIQSYRSDVIYK